MTAAIIEHAGALLDWYDRNRRTLPWRAAPGKFAEPYHVWLSEIMLQQTTVAAVQGYYRRFLSLWPRLDDLAMADLDAVLHAWQGLGYYARARNLHRCAQILHADYGGRFPDNEAGLRALPGIGRYTAAAIAAIAFDRPAVVVDGNIERVVARLFAVEGSLPGIKPKVTELAGLLTPTDRPGDHAQAMMDLGATVCLPRAPLCQRCPWQEVCRGHLAGIAATLPIKAPKAGRPTRYGIAFWLVRGDGAVLLRRRPERGLLGGMIEIPSTEWRGQPWPGEVEPGLVPADGAWRMLPGKVAHTFTHFHLELAVARANIDGAGASIDGIWSPIDRLGEHALPSVMKKVVRYALGAGQPATSSRRGSSGAKRR